MALTKRQQAAVEYENNLILFAGPGSGKTSTSVAKAQFILSKPKNSLVMVSFTRTAANETKERLNHKLAEAGMKQALSRLEVGTFHSLASRHYRTHCPHPRSLLGPLEKKRLIDQILTGKSKDEIAMFTLALEKFQGSMNQASVVFSQSSLEDPLNGDQSELQQTMMEFCQTYERMVDHRGVLDLAMLLRESTMRMLSGEWPLLKVTHMIGDEMQDGDELQLAMMLAHAHAGVITTLVADDDQTIYEWRSALGYRGLQEFAAQANAKTIALSDNFRSREEVVHHAKKLIAYNDPDRVEKNQRATRGPGGGLAYMAFAEAENQYQAIANYYLQCRRDGETMAVLSRNNFPLRALGVVLYENGIPYVSTGEKIWDHAEVQSYLLMLDIVVSGRSAMLCQMLGNVMQLDGNLRRDITHHYRKHKCFDLLQGEIPDLPSATPIDMEQLREFTRHTKRWRGQIMNGAVSMLLGDSCEVFNDHWLSMHVASMDYSPQRKAAMTRSIKNNLSSILKILQGLKGKLSQRLQAIERLKNSKPGPDVIQLMTIHGSKGMEFDTVFVIEAVEADAQATELISLQAERRLFYVAITRAKERFYGLYSNTPSRFLVEAQIPDMTGKLTWSMEKVDDN